MINVVPTWLMLVRTIGPDAYGNDRADLLAATGRLDRTYEHENVHLQMFEKGDMLVCHSSRTPSKFKFSAGRDSSPVCKGQICVNGPGQGGFGRTRRICGLVGTPG